LNIKNQEIMTTVYIPYYISADDGTHTLYCNELSDFIRPFYNKLDAYKHLLKTYCNHEEVVMYKETKNKFNKTCERLNISYNAYNNESYCRVYHFDFSKVNDEQNTILDNYRDGLYGHEEPFIILEEWNDCNMDALNDLINKVNEGHYDSAQIQCGIYESKIL